MTPGGDYDAAYELLGETGRAALQQWVTDGGRLVSMAGGTVLATMLGLTSATLADPTSDVPGSLIRAKVRPGPLAKGVGDRVWSFYAYDYVMTVDDPAAAPIYYPTTNSPAWFVSGYERGASELARTAVVVDERYGAGRVVAFAGEPNFRGFTDGTQKGCGTPSTGRTRRRRRGQRRPSGTRPSAKPRRSRALLTRCSSRCATHRPSGSSGCSTRTRSRPRPADSTRAWCSTGS